MPKTLLSVVLFSICCLSVPTPTTAPTLVQRYGEEPDVACATEYPSLLTVVGNTHPDTTLGIDTIKYVRMSRSDSGLDKNDVLVQFSCIPAASLNCQLEMAWPAACLPMDSESAIVSVFAVDRDIRTQVNTWNTAPQKDLLVGSLVFSPSEVSQTQILGMMPCEPTLNFRFSMPNNSTDAAAGYWQRSESGLRLVHDC
ncbi:MAG: hypothetical protein M1825_001699 [Sarcosagium campestre]|nr:MAG: hypothetical protein M1825_001699 [Sarcosagium campestre]